VVRAWHYGRNLRVLSKGGGKTKTSESIEGAFTGWLLRAVQKKNQSINHSKKSEPPAPGLGTGVKKKTIVRGRTGKKRTLPSPLPGDISAGTPERNRIVESDSGATKRGDRLGELGWVCGGGSAGVYFAEVSLQGWPPDGFWGKKEALGNVRKK